MIDRIVILCGQRLKGETFQFSGILVFPIPAEARLTVSGMTVVPTPSVSLPDEVLQYDILSADTIAALDAGEAIFQIETITTHGQIEEAVLQHVVEDAYPKKQLEVLEAYVLKWERFGKKVL